MKNLNKVRISYNKEIDGYSILLSTDGGKTWGECLTCFCQRREEESEEAEPEYIHCSLIEKLKECIRLGYTVVY